MEILLKKNEAFKGNEEEEEEEAKEKEDKEEMGT